MDIAITRQVSRSIAECELTFLTRQPIDLGRARQQHRDYEEALRGLGLAVLSLPEEPDLPDAVFVEDTALVLPECAVMLRPGAGSRRGEVESVARALRPYRELRSIQAPGHLDGGDVLRVGRRIYVGLTQRSEAAAARQLSEILSPFGYQVETVPVTGCLHLKSAATEVAEGILLINLEWVNAEAFGEARILEVDATEPYAANALRIGDRVVYAAGFPRTEERLARAGIPTVVVEADELAKAEGAVTCCSLILTA